MWDNIDIRQARTEDAAQISALILGVAHYFSSPSAETVAAWLADSITPSAIERCVRDPHFNYLVAYSGPTLAGVIAMRDAAHVHHLFVASKFHRRGIASRLWARAQEGALLAGNQDGFFVRSSAYAVPVYERFGFRVAGHRSERDGIIFVPMHLTPLHSAPAEPG